jgi:hypothetical protein
VPETTEDRKKFEARFLHDVRDHKISIIRDDGVNRHIRFRRPESYCYGFDLITWPGHLLVTGDCGTWAFARLEDMFEFFRIDPSDWNFAKEGGLSINPGYWSEKLIAVDCRGRHQDSGPMQFSDAVFEAAVKDHFEQATEDMDEVKKAELWERIEEDVLNADSEEDARQRARDFEHEGFEFTDFWEHNLRDWTFHSIWNLFAIVWGIARYDETIAAKVAA